jgi:hypothetical protein
LPGRKAPAEIRLSPTMLGQAFGKLAVDEGRAGALLR